MLSAARGIRRDELPASLLLLACLSASVALASCGGGRPAKTPTEHEVDLTKLGQARAGSTPQPVTIDRPRRGETLVASMSSEGRIELSAVVRGHAQPFQSIKVGAGCRQSACTRYVTSERDGRWQVRLDLLLESRRSVWLTADYALAHGGHTASKLRVKVRAAGSQSSAPPNSEPAPPVAQPSPPAAARHSLVLIGDSLAVGIKPLLPRLLPGWTVSVDGRVGRPLAEGMAILAHTPLPSDGSTVLAISLFTNDDPTHLTALQQAVQTTLARVGARGCVIWASIVSHPVGGVTYARANALLERLAAQDPRLQLVPWARAVKESAGLLGPDGVHPTPQGYELRAQLYAQAAEACA